MDFVTRLPESNGYDAILVIVDQLTKMKHLVPCKITADADNIAKIYISEVWKHHGLPETIVSNHRSLFTSNFWKRLCQRLGMVAKLSTSFHPQTDGQTEIVNAAMESILWSYVNYLQNDWEEWIPLCEFAINNQSSEITKMIPFFADNGSHPQMGFEKLPTT